MKLPDKFRTAFYGVLFLWMLLFVANTDYMFDEPWTRDTVHLATYSGVNSYCPPQDGLTLASEVISDYCRKNGEYK